MEHSWRRTFNPLKAGTSSTPLCTAQSRWHLTTSLNGLRLNAVACFLSSCGFIPRHDVYAHGQNNVRGNQKVADDQDLPTAYLLFAIAAIIFIGVTAAGAFIILIRN